ncbi:MAG: Holliday junction branch migration protein RuvA [Gammaproteobacteria bacterium]|nr:Holliday junction branch migration protein RuvA [Gammaproteobacteria bacterium]MDH3370232.1 Holliday junction branch migration protein RuvA [Gammaproteobacteria bacterium]MDH3406006.1 Holliday junction branch migration protein RuvA [Gammaproteobacteria bacterium]MDH3561909.1 Holliday junction branch migration protein RuvA [Gammaproteobacteria bacterium]MDH5486373.1 Holliday junction branch migration protein RuvA [Gammaproteobacteria bacterium]
MIGRLHGVLLRKEPPAMLVDVSGVAYELEAPMTTFYELPAVGNQVTLYTHLVIREDAHLLYGFVRETQRRLFRDLLKVNGVGPRVALAVLSGLPDEEFTRCVAEEDITRLTKVPGIGRKTAERLVIEMRDKLPKDVPVLSTRPAAGTGAAPSDPVSEAVSALVSLGYKPNEASRAVRGVSAKGLNTEEIIRQALKGMAG